MSKFNSVTKIWSGASNPSIYNPNLSLGYLMLKNLQKSPNRIVQINADNAKETSASEIYEKSIKIVKFLSSLGLQQHEVVGFIGKNSENQLPIVIACFTLGLPINPLATIMIEAEIIFMYLKTRPKVIFCDANLIENVKSAVEKMKLDCKIFTLINRVKGFQFIDDVIEADKNSVDNFEYFFITFLLRQVSNFFIFRFPELNDIASTAAFIHCSSGTTNSVKGIVKTHKEFICNNAHCRWNEIYFFTAELYWTIQSICIFWNILYDAKRIITTREITPEWFMEIIEKFQPTFVLCRSGIRYPLMRSKTIRKSERKLIFTLTGVVITEDIVDGLKPIFPNAIFLGAYGMTEVDFVTIAPILQKKTSSGVVVDNVQVKVNF